MLEERPHGTKGSIGKTTAEAFGGVAALIEMMIVEKGVEGGMSGLNLRLGSATEESMPLGELEGVAEHVQLRECGLRGGRRPVLLDIIHCRTPILDLLRCPLLLEQEVIVTGRSRQDEENTKYNAWVVRIPVEHAYECFLSPVVAEKALLRRC